VSGWSGLSSGQAVKVTPTANALSAGAQSVVQTALPTAVTQFEKAE